MGQVSARNPSKWQILATAYWILKTFCIFAWVSLCPPDCKLVEDGENALLIGRSPAQHRPPSGFSVNTQGWAEGAGEARAWVPKPRQIPTLPLLGCVPLPLISLPPLCKVGTVTPALSKGCGGYATHSISRATVISLLFLLKGKQRKRNRGHDVQ